MTRSPYVVITVFPIDDLFSVCCHNGTAVQGLLSCEDLVDVPIAVLTNKIDVPGALGEDAIARSFGVHDILSGKQLVSDPHLFSYYYLI